MLKVVVVVARRGKCFGSAIMSLLRNASLSFLTAALFVFLGWFTGYAVGWLIEYDKRGAGAFVGLVGSYRHVDLELCAGTAMYMPGPRIELAEDVADAWPLVSPFVSKRIL
jgi:hypothetical protein